MKVRTRFIRSVIQTAESCDTRMPWARGARRRTWIAARGTDAARLVKTA